jgi:hypothetical protein
LAAVQGTPEFSLVLLARVICRSLIRVIYLADETVLELLLLLHDQVSY